MRRLLPMAACLMISACGSMPQWPQSTPATPPPQPTPAACLQPCPDLPELRGNLRDWVADLLDAVGVCDRLHQSCVGQMKARKVP